MGSHHNTATREGETVFSQTFIHTTKEKSKCSSQGKERCSCVENHKKKGKNQSRYSRFYYIM